MGQPLVNPPLLVRGHPSLMAALFCVTIVVSTAISNPTVLANHQGTPATETSCSAASSRTKSTAKLGQMHKLNKELGLAQLREWQHMWQWLKTTLRILHPRRGSQTLRQSIFGTVQLLVEHIKYMLLTSCRPGVVRRQALMMMNQQLPRHKRVHRKMLEREKRRHGSPQHHRFRLG